MIIPFILMTNLSLFNTSLPTASSKPPKIEEVYSKSKVTAPKYKIMREPPEGRPEFLVIEIALPGIVSTKFI